MENIFQIMSNDICPSNAATAKLGSIEMNLRLLQWFGLPLFGAQREMKISFLLYGILVWTLFRIPYHVFEVHDAILCLGNIDDLIQNVCMTLLHIGGSVKTLLVLSHLGGIHSIITQLRFLTKKYVRTERQYAAFAWLEIENKMALMIYFFLVGGSAAVAMIWCIIDPSTFLGQMFPYRAKVPDWVPFSVQKFYVPISVLLIGGQIVGIDYLNVTFINLIRCQLQVLNISFDELRDQATLNPLKQLNSIVRHHTYILKVREQVESVFKFPMLVQFVCSLMIYGLTGFQALVGSNVSGQVMIYFFVGCILAQLFVCCWYGNEVSEQNKTLSLRGYDTSWYNFDVKFRKSLVIFLLNAQRPLYFTAGGYVQLSLMTFGGVLSKSYSLVAVLRQSLADA